MSARIYYGEGVVTSIDHAYIDSRGDIIGGSLTPMIEIGGKVTEDEHVIVDFSTGKKQIKALIDDKEDGYDHKLWIGGFSFAEIRKSAIDDGFVRIETPKWKIKVPTNAVKFIEADHYDGVIYDISRQLTEKLEYKYDIGLSSNELPRFAPVCHMADYFAPFRYTHGLKSSTSWGCQNIAHGHYSYISIAAEEQYEANALATKIANDLDRKMFAWSQNVVPNGIQYCTDRGQFNLTYIGNEMSDDVIVLDTETTIENLVEWVATKYEKQLKDMYAYSLVMSEGTQKGAKIVF